MDGDGDIDADDVKALTQERAIDLFGGEFWDRYHYDSLFNDGVAIKTFDLAVNMGPRPAHRCLQRALRALKVVVVDDGILGPKTQAAVNTVHGPTLLIALRSEAAGFYRGLVAGDPVFEKYIKGWLNRAYS